GCAQYGSIEPRPAPTPTPQADLTVPCGDPGLTGDKGRDALRHRAALVACEGKRAGWQNLYETVSETRVK
ncbi:MAG: hypothetical protein ABJD57_23325, partial [Roseibium sp.]|uniref:hypothetical protein n=1 Tax=Roseibium sp. TaxID=1936156 RepID=UPI0032663928